MNIAAVSSASSVSALDLSDNMDMPANVSMAVSVQVLDMAQAAFSDAADRLLAEMTAAMTGIGQSVDMTV